MAFSIKNIFQRGSPGDPEDGTGMAAGQGGVAVMGAAPDQSQMPGGFGGALFRTVGDGMDGAPVAAGSSPFSPFGASGGATITVGDLLPCLPAEVARAGGAAPEQPVSLSPQVLEAAISSGQLAVPIFEVYRVCPALFQAPVSPHDPRMVPLPKGKLPGMIATHTGALKPAQSPFSVPQSAPQPPPNGSPFAAAQSGAPSPFSAAGGASPFSVPGASPAQPASLFAPALPDLPPHGHVDPHNANPGQSGPPTGGVRPAGTLPPRRPPGMAPPIPTQADFVAPGGGAPGGLSLPGTGNDGPGHGGSPFGVGGSPMQAQPAAHAPFMPAAQPLVAPPSQSLLGGHRPGQAVDPELEGGAPQAGPMPFGLPQNNPPPVMERKEFAPFSPPAQMPPQPHGPQTGPLGQPPGQAFFAPAQQPASFTSMSQPPPVFSPAPQAPAFTPAQPTPAFALAQQSFAPATAPQPAPFAMPFPMPGGGQPPAPAENPSPFLSGPGAGPHAAPFAPAGQPAAAPFAPPAVASFEVPQREVQSEPPKLGQLPFSAPGPQQPMVSMSKTPVPPASSRTIKVVPPPGMSAPQGAAPAADSEVMEVPLAAVLRGQSASDLGFDPSFLPAWITTKLPAAEVRSQLPTGQVQLELGAIIDGTDATFRSVIAHGNRACRILVSAAEVFSALPPSRSSIGTAPAASPAPAPGSAPAPAFVAPAAPVPAFTPSFPAAEQSPPLRAATVPLQPQPGAFAGFGGPGAPVPSAPSPVPNPAVEAAMPWQAAAPAPPPQMPAFDQFQSAAPPFVPAEPVSPKNDGLGSEQLFGPAAGAAPAGRPTTRPLAQFGAPSPLVPPQTSFAQPMADSFFGAESPAEAPRPPLPLDASRTPSQAMPKPAAPTTANAPAAGVMAAASLGLNAAKHDDDQMMLRALLGTADHLTVERVVQMVASIPGVIACANARGVKVFSHGEASSAGQDFRNQAVEIARSMRTLASVIGIDGETLSIATGERLITFCFQGENAFGVLHADKTAPAGLREKITLLSREVARMSM